METSGDIRVFFVLIPVFLLTGAWLIVWTRRRAGMMRDFARHHAFRIDPNKNQEIEETLNEAFALHGPLIRNYGRVRDVVDAGGVTLFRTTELIDRNPYGQSQNTHFGRVAALFNAPPNSDLDLLVQRAQITNRHPDRTPYDGDPGFPAVQRALEEAPPGKPLAVIFRNGRGLICMEPLVVGGEKMADVEYLYALASRLSA